MKISALMAMWMCVVFAIVCFSVAVTGFAAISTMADAAERDLSWGYAWFWTFLGAIAVAFGILSWMIKAGKLGDPEQM